MGRAVALKKMRRFAEMATVGRPLKAYKVIKRMKQFWNEKTQNWIKVPRYQVVLDPFCTRATYQRLKKANPPGTHIPTQIVRK